MGKVEKRKALCSGCYNDDYNYGLGGSRECWSFSSAKVIDRIAIPVDIPPPYDKDRAEPMMDCFTKKRWVFVRPEVLDSRGYWKS